MEKEFFPCIPDTDPRKFAHNGAWPIPYGFGNMYFKTAVCQFLGSIERMEIF
jgi:hypothetical protein